MGHRRWVRWGGFALLLGCRCATTGSSADVPERHPALAAAPSAAPDTGIGGVRREELPAGDASAANEAPRSREAPSADRAAGRRESERCRDAKIGILRTMMRSGEEARCARDEDCSLVPSPETPDRDARIAVARRDAAVLEGASRAHLSSCGAVRQPVKSHDSFVTVDARCDSRRCVGLETTFHPSPILD